MWEDNVLYFLFVFFEVVVWLYLLCDKLNKRLRGINFFIGGLDLKLLISMVNLLIYCKEGLFYIEGKKFVIKEYFFDFLLKI